MTDKKKPSAKKALVVCLLCAGILSIVVILVTCKLFDPPMIETGPDWNRIIKNSTWTLNQKNVNEEAVCIGALKGLTSIKFSEDLYLTINYGSYSFDAGKFVLDNSMKVRQAGEGGYTENTLVFNFSQKDETYLLTIEVSGVGSYYLFKN